MDQAAGYIGRKALRSISHIIDLSAFTWRIFTLIFYRPKAGKALVRRISLEQVYSTSVQALPTIIPTALIIGSTLIVLFVMLPGQYGEMGEAVTLLIVRELGPFIMALFVILRSATVITIEISCMNIFHEIDAIEMSGLDPMQIVCLPRFTSIVFATFCLFIIFSMVAIGGGVVVTWTIMNIPVEDLFYQIGKAITAVDIIVGIAKAVCFGIIIGVTCLYRGLKTEKRMTEISTTTSMAAVESFFYCLIMNVIISTVFYMSGV